MICRHTDIRTRDKARTRFQCADCSKWFNDKNVPSMEHRKPIKNAPKILLFDTENAPNIAGVWNVWNQNIAPVQIFNDWYLLSWAAKWLNDSKIMGDVLTSKEAVKEDDKRLVRNLWNLFNEADWLIAHNASAFDIPIANTRFIMNGLTPPSSYQVIDTLKVARKQFNFTHNKMSFLADRLDIPHNKLETEFQLWKDCKAGKRESLKYMLKYNKMDVTVLEELYLKLRPWIKSHPNWNLYSDTGGCAVCGSTKLKRNGTYTTTVSLYNSYQCKQCGSFSRTDKGDNKSSLRSLAR